MSRLFFLIFFSFFFIAGCTGFQSIEENSTHITKEIDGIEYYLFISSTEMNLGDEVEVRGTVKNISNHPIDYIGYNGCDNGVSVFIPIPNHERYFLQKDWDTQEGRPCTEAIEEYVLQPGEVIEEQKVFIPKMYGGSGKGMDVPTGEYNATFVFQRGGMDSIDSGNTHEQIKLKFHLNGGKQIITKQEAEQTANANNELQEWLSERVGSKITKEENGQFFVMDDGKWNKATKQYYKQMQNYKPEYWTQYKDSKWTMTYVDKLQKSPHRFELIIDEKTGKIIEVNKYAK